MSFWSLYSILFLIAFGGYFTIKYLIKGLSKLGVFDDTAETRYTPPTKTTHMTHAGLMVLLGVMILIIVI